MTKILLVEDDKSLREIYGVRLLAEGYDIVTASDGEEALAIAIKEHPALIIADVMMPKISGFDMLDILKSTAETRNIKVIVMTALSSEDQRARGERIGADRYLVKSQVGIEDVVRTVHEVLEDKPSAPPAQAPPPVQPPQPQAPQAPVSPVQPQAPPAQPAPTPQQPPVQPPTPVQAPQQQVWQQPPAGQVYGAQPHAMQPQSNQPQTHAMPPPASSLPPRPANKPRVIQPLNNFTQKVDINELLDKELAKEAGSGAALPQVNTTEQERQIVNEQIAAAQAPAQQPAYQPQAPQQVQVSSQQATGLPNDRTSVGQAPIRPDVTPPQR